MSALEEENKIIFITKMKINNLTFELENMRIKSQIKGYFDLRAMGRPH